MEDRADLIVTDTNVLTLDRQYRRARAVTGGRVVYCADGSRSDVG